MKKRGNIIPIRFSDEEKQALKQRAQLEGSTISAIVRKAIQQFLMTPMKAIGRSHSVDQLGLGMETRLTLPIRS